jgi:hypothetical protein
MLIPFVDDGKVWLHHKFGKKNKKLNLVMGNIQHA